MSLYQTNKRSEVNYSAYPINYVYLYYIVSYDNVVFNVLYSLVFENVHDTGVLL
jgi:hypothetical protein